MSTHELKVQQPYFDALVDGSKTFEVRRNDRAYQRGDVLHLREWIADDSPMIPDGGWYNRGPIVRTVTSVYSGDPRWGGIEPGYVVLSLGAAPSVDIRVADALSAVALAQDAAHMVLSTEDIVRIALGVSS